jgi:hypothetical protein
MSLSLKKALTKRNITKGFSATWIWPVNIHVVDSMLGPSQLFYSPLEETDMRTASLGACSDEGQADRGDVPASRQLHGSWYSDEEDEPELEARQGAHNHEEGLADQDHHEDNEVQGGQGHEQEDDEQGGQGHDQEDDKQGGQGHDQEDDEDGEPPSTRVEADGGLE